MMRSLTSYGSFLSLGRDGFTRIVNAELANARLLSGALERSYFTV